MKLIFTALILLTAFNATAQQKSAPAAAPPVTPSVAVSSPDSQLRLLRAQHSLDSANDSLNKAKIDWIQFINQANEEAKKDQEAVTKATAASEAAEKVYQGEIDAIAKSLGIDLTKYSFDREKQVFAPLASPAPVTPSPVKK